MNRIEQDKIVFSPVRFKRGVSEALAKIISIDRIPTNVGGYDRWSVKSRLYGVISSLEGVIHAIKLGFLGTIKTVENGVPLSTA